MPISLKSAVDYLLDWAREQGEWAELLTNNVVYGDMLSDNKRSEIIDLLIEGTTNKLKKSLTAVQSDEVTVNKVKLNKLYCVSGVNKLAKGQEISFHDKLTIIYGDNGSGKTGYYRILKSIGECVDSENKVLGNVFGEKEKQKAIIDYTIDGIAEKFEWENDNRKIPGILVFDTKCAKISIGKNRKTNIKPIGFEYFNIVSQELSQMEKKVDEIIDVLRSQLLIKEFSTETASKRFFQGLIASDTNEKIESFSIQKITTLNEINKKLDELEEVYKQLNPEMINQVIKNCGVISAECNVYKETIENIISVFQRQKIEEYFNAVDENENTKEIIPEFNEFLLYAKKYIDKQYKSTYPNIYDKCIYCGQHLSDESIEHINSCNLLLQSGSAVKFNNNKRRIEAFEKCVASIQPILYKKEIFELVNCGDFSSINSAINSCIKNLKQINSKMTEDERISIFELQYDILRTDLNDYGKKVDKEIEQQRDKLDNLSDLININKIEKAEWTDYKWIVENREKIKQYLSTLKKIQNYVDKKEKLHTYKLSAKMKTAQKKIITEAYKLTLDNEFKRLRCPDNIVVDVSISNTIPSIKQNIQQKELDEILSEGEQKIVSLAEFITEIEMDKQVQTVIFDDPINSLDIRRSFEVAKRLIDLTIDNQVIIFTHNPIFFNDLQDLVGKKCHTYYSVQSDGLYSGYVYHELAPKDESFKYYIDKVNEVIRREGDRTKSINEELRDGYSFLRSALECIYEKEFLQESIVRFRRNIMTGRLKTINWVEFEKNKESFTDIFDRACTALNGHTNADTLVRPTMQDLRTDYEETKRLRELLK